MSETLEHEEILLIHMGGLGDVCLSESLFFSLSRHFNGFLVACGIKRFFELFPHYFIRIENIESAKWLFLFSHNPSQVKWKRIIFVGKDRSGSLRERLERFSIEDLIFIEMYPELGTKEKIKHVEDFQLEQLKAYSIRPLKKEISPIWKDRIILYPEKGFSKKKWEVDRFLELYRRFKEDKRNVFIMEPFDAMSKTGGSIVIKELKEVKNFFKEGGIFVSNDSGMAHLAGACGMLTVTIFTDFDPVIWHPRGINISLRAEDLNVETVLEAAYSLEATYR
ncbi:MAG TPA: glycosyltransferase family 9 protein [Syntrophorhabdaceae bacterium]|nr:glycosyltransferase family 9 protein [Syntrophorhabdaceae bacterium]